MAKGGVTVRLEKDLHYAAKIAAAREGIPLERLVADAIADRLHTRGHPTDLTLPATTVTP